MERLQLQALCKALERERADIVSRLEHSHSYGLEQSMNDAVSELSGYDQHPADLGSEMFEREKDLALEEHDRLRLDDIMQALDRMVEGSYGLCQRCDEPVEPQRLEAEPAARLCIACAQLEDHRRVTNDRPVEEEVLSPPFALSDRDGPEDTGFDEEDTWEAVTSMDETADLAGARDDLLDPNGVDFDEGVVEAVERISNDEYHRQLP
ncbi:MAG: TraR/DksA C4-type zinc finger protein [Firmicutes bacterium]|nr:TraR/DksA C4-type zinc finger protein [Bacillota bacterium]